MTLFQAYALSLVGLPYVWGGNHPLSGFDCSGLAIYLSRFTDCPITSDADADGIYALLLKRGAKRLSVPAQGSYLFYGLSVDAITHVAIALDDYRLIEAGGGNSSTTTLGRAVVQGACVRGNFFGHRKDLVAILLPPYSHPL